MDKKVKKSILLGITGLFLVSILLIGITYAYYRTVVFGNESTDPSISVVSEKLEIRYLDGNSTVNMEGKIFPGFVYTKTFSVENTGDESVKYAVYLEGVNNTFTRTQDWTVEMTCSPNCDGIDGEIEYPKLNSKIVENVIPSGVIQTYNITIEYADSEENQSIDMGATLSGKFQIYTPEGVIDIEGTVSDAEEGDYVQINSNPKRSEIVDGAYRLTAVELGEHTLSVFDKNNNLKGQSRLIIQSGEEGYSGNTISTTPQTEKVTIDITDLSVSPLGIIISGLKREEFNFENAKEGTLLYLLKERHGTANSVEDDYNKSYYFYRRMNYVNYAGMCWNVVRVQGNGVIKLALLDESKECNVSGTKVPYINNSTKYQYSSGTYEYSKSNIPSILNTWLNNKITDQSYLETTEWCNDMSVFENIYVCRNNNTGTIYLPGDEGYYEHCDWAENADIFKDTYFGAYGRLIKNSPVVNPTLKCDMNGALKYSSNIGLLTADEIAILDLNFDSWTMTPYANSFYYYGDIDIFDGNLKGTDTSDDKYITPVISIKSTTPATLDYAKAEYWDVPPGTDPSVPYVIE